MAFRTKLYTRIGMDAVINAVMTGLVTAGHAGFCRIYKCRTHLGSDDQIRSKDVKIFFCPADDIQIYIFADIFVIQWRIGIRLDESFFICLEKRILGYASFTVTFI